MKLLVLSLVTLILAACASKPVKPKLSEYVIGCTTGMLVKVRMDNQLTEENEDGLTNFFAGVCVQLEQSYHERLKRALQE